MHELGAAEWQAHIDNDLEQSKDIAVIKMAMFGDMNKPETLRNALHPTMMRINAFIDVWKWIGGVAIGAGITAPLWLPLVKMVLHELAR